MTLDSPGHEATYKVSKSAVWCWSEPSLVARRLLLVHLRPVYAVKVEERLIVIQAMNDRECRLLMDR